MIAYVRMPKQFQDNILLENPYIQLNYEYIHITC